MPRSRSSSRTTAAPSSTSRPCRTPPGRPRHCPARSCNSCRSPPSWSAPTDPQALIERARTVLDLGYDQTYAPQTLKEYQADNSQKLNSYQRLADVVIITSLPIAGCSLAVSVAGGLAERKRAFSLLRLTGTPLAVLRRVVTLESAAPLLVSAVVSAGAGLLAAQLFLRAQLYETLRPPGPEYYGTVLAGLVLSLAVIASSLPLLSRLTGPETARNE